MRILADDTRIDFIGRRRLAALLSSLLLLITLGSLIYHGGPNYGIDFKGGTLVHVKFKEVAPITKVRAVIAKLNVGEFSIQEFGQPEELLIRVGQEDSAEGDSEAKIVESALHDAFGQNFSVERVEMVGPKVGSDLRYKALMALIYSLAGILIYITFRFEFRFGVAAIVALAHDTMITIGAFSILDKEFTLPVIAAILTVIGYSLNDTIVVFDRIRENMRLKRGLELGKLLNLSINQTLSRTLLTSGTTLIVVLAIFFLGGGVIHDFAFALFVGIFVGTYSSIFVASPVLLLWQRYQQRSREKEASEKKSKKKRKKAKA